MFAKVELQMWKMAAWPLGHLRGNISLVNVAAEIRLSRRPEWLPISVLLRDTVP